MQCDTFDDLTELAPAFATIAKTAFTCNIVNGLTAGLGPGILALAPACLRYFISGRPHEIPA
jgi:xanthine/uracil/vitamin C permease (AzgA family)